MEEHSTKVIVVLGMHRSGTSVIARGLQVLGVELGDRLMPESEGNNAKGFWEDVDINALNIEMLHSLKTDWHFLTPLASSDVDTLCRNGYLQRAVDLLQKKTASANVFGFKDPRVAKLLPFWKQVFEHSNINVNYIVVIRHPRSVCDSLAKRDQLDHEKSYLLWLEHVISSLVGTEGEKRVLVDYDTFMQEPENELTRVARELQLPINATELQHYRLEFLDRKLQHTVYQLDDLAHENAPPLVQEVYSSLLNVIAGNVSPEDPSLTDKIALWKNEFSRLRSMLLFIDRLVLRFTATNAERKALKAERESFFQEKAQLRQASVAKEQALQSLRAELLEVHQSPLWRWTIALKRVRSFFQKPK